MLLAKPLAAATSDSNVFGVVIGYFDELVYETTADGSMDYVRLDTGLTPVDGSWHHVAVRWTGTEKHILIDGTLLALDPTSLLDSDEAVLIGHDVDNGTSLHSHHGGLDEIRFYARAVTDDEIRLLATP